MRAFPVNSTRRSVLQGLAAGVVFGAISKKSFAKNAQDYLPVDEAFKFSSEIVEGKVRLKWTIAQGCSLYKSRIHARITSPEQLSLKNPVWPKAQIHTDEFFGKQEVYTGELILDYPVMCTISGLNGMEMEVSYQGCADAGLCYNPEIKKLELPVPPKACGF